MTKTTTKTKQAIPAPKPGTTRPPWSAESRRMFLTAAEELPQNKLVAFLRKHGVSRTQLKVWADAFAKHGEAGLVPMRPGRRSPKPPSAAPAQLDLGFTTAPASFDAQTPGAHLVATPATGAGHVLVFVLPDATAATAFLRSLQT